MRAVFRILRVTALLSIMICLILSAELVSPVIIVAPILLLSFAYAFSRRSKQDKRRLRWMMRGYDLLLDLFVFIFAGTAVLIGGRNWFGWFTHVNDDALWIVVIVFAVLTVLAMLIGVLIVAFTSKRLGVVWRVMLLTLWWVPIFNIFLFIRVLRQVRVEYRIAGTHALVMEAHAKNRDCATKYPILLVHGIFFRDWQLLNYWGRIPRELERCGAKLFYGGQQSAAPVEESGLELAKSIRRVIEETGAEKVNIIAHSKGGLDSRYAISRLGCAPLTASLTTINTPHRGCVWARVMLEKLPENTLKSIDGKYEKIFRALGDRDPDFLGGVRDLTDDAAKRFNAETPDSPDVYYQSAMSIIGRASSAPFPLNICRELVSKYDGELNDGLVPRSSAPWGNFLGEIKIKGKRGVSHGDVIDLFREDIEGFDASAFYADIVRGLKLKGF